MFLADKRHPVSTEAAWTCSTIDALFSTHQHPVLRLLQKVHVDIFFAALHRPEEPFEKKFLHCSLTLVPALTVSIGTLV